MKYYLIKCFLKNQKGKLVLDGQYSSVAYAASFCEYGHVGTGWIYYFLGTKEHIDYELLENTHPLLANICLFGDRFSNRASSTHILNAATEYILQKNYFDIKKLLF